MAGATVVIFHPQPRDGDPPLTRLLGEARGRLIAHQTRLFVGAGARRVLVVPGREDAPGSWRGSSLGERLARLIDEERIRGGLVVFGSGAVPLLAGRDAVALVDAASSARRLALTNNRYSSDICAVGDVRVLRNIPPLPSDNALPRWLEERASVAVAELPGRDRLALDLDTPLDLALLALLPTTPRPLRELAAAEALRIPRIDEMRALARNPRRELLVFGRSGSATLRWLERNVRCRVRFLAEERGLRASSPLAIEAPPPKRSRPPRATLGRLLELRGPEAFADIVAELADGAIIDTRVLMADRLGSDEDSWPSPEDRFASDLLHAEDVGDPWLRELTASAADGSIPIVLGSHTLVGPGIRVLLGGGLRA